MWNRTSIICVVLTGLLFATGAPFSHAQAQDNKQKQAPAAAPETLDDLFAKLKKERRPKIAERISQRIWVKWRNSDSDTINLLSGWARTAISEDKFGIALDLLDQVTTLRPDYVEGWNQRATLHYLMKNYGKSMRDVERVLVLEPRHFGALSGLGLIFQAFDEKEKALDAWYKVLEVYPALNNAQKAVISLEDQIAAKRI